MGNKSPRPKTVADRCGARPPLESCRAGIDAPGPSPSRRPSALSQSALRGPALGLLLQCPDDTREGPTGDPHERDRHGEKSDHVRLEPNGTGGFHVRTDRD